VQGGARRLGCETAVYDSTTHEQRVCTQWLLVPQHMLHAAGARVCLQANNVQGPGLEVKRATRTPTRAGSQCGTRASPHRLAQKRHGEDHSLAACSHMHTRGAASACLCTCSTAQNAASAAASHITHMPVCTPHRAAQARTRCAARPRQPTGGIHATSQHAHTSQQHSHSARTSTTPQRKQPNDRQLATVAKLRTTWMQHCASRAAQRVAPNLDSSRRGAQRTGRVLVCRATSLPLARMPCAHVDTQVHTSAQPVCGAAGRSPHHAVIADTKPPHHSSRLFPRHTRRQHSCARATHTHRGTASLLTWPPCPPAGNRHNPLGLADHARAPQFLQNATSSHKAWVTG
jgi:hypothetical protein